MESPQIPVAYAGDFWLSWDHLSKLDIYPIYPAEISVIVMTVTTSMTQVAGGLFQCIPR